MTINAASGQYFNKYITNSVEYHVPCGLVVRISGFHPGGFDSPHGRTGFCVILIRKFYLHPNKYQVLKAQKQTLILAFNYLLSSTYYFRNIFLI